MRSILLCKIWLYGIAEGEAYAKERAENTGRAILKHNSKGANKGKIAKK